MLRFQGKSAVRSMALTGFDPENASLLFVFFATTRRYKLKNYVLQLFPECANGLDLSVLQEGDEDDYSKNRRGCVAVSMPPSLVLPPLSRNPLWVWDERQREDGGEMVNQSTSHSHSIHSSQRQMEFDCTHFLRNFVGC